MSFVIIIEIYSIVISALKSYDCIVIDLLKDKNSDNNSGHLISPFLLKRKKKLMLLKDIFEFVNYKSDSRNVNGHDVFQVRISCFDILIFILRHSNENEKVMKKMIHKAL